MNIGIDARLILVNERGISNYIYNLVDNFIKIDKNNRYFLYINTKYEYATDKEKIRQKLGQFAKEDNIIIKNIKSNGTFFWEQLYLPLAIIRDKIDIMHMTSNRSPFLCGCRLINTMHDVMELENIEKKDHYKLKTLKGKFYEWRVKQYIKFIYRRSFKKSDKIITVSEKSKKDIHKLLGIPENKIRVITHGIDEGFKNLNLNRRYIMTFGGTALQKNPEGPIEAYSYLPDKMKEKYPLLIVGSDDKTKIQGILRRYNIKNFIIKEFVQKEELVRLYNKSKIFLFLSVSEGFGFPPLEAMACGTVPLAYNISPMRENINNSRLCVEFKNNRKVSERIEELIRNKKDYNKLALIGVKRSKSFSWQDSAKKHLDIYKEIYKNEV